MGKIIEHKLNRFDRGITPNIRLADKRHSSIAVRVDASKDSAIKPYKDFEADAITESTLDPFGIEKFLWTGSEFFGFGRVSGASEVTQLYKKSGVTDVWTTETNGTSGSGGARNTKLFVYYKNQDTIYGGNNTGIWSYTVAGDTFTYNESSSITPTGQGIVHSKDDILYVPAGAAIASKDEGGAWTADAFVGLPADYNTVSIAEHGNFLLIAGNRGANGVLYYWDRDSTVNTATDSVLFGDNTIKWVETVHGIPIVCCTRIDATTGDNEVVFYAMSGNLAEEVLSFNAGASGNVKVKSDTQRYGDSIQFLMGLTFGGLTNGETLVGIWSLNRKPDGALQLDFVTPPANDDNTIPASNLKGFFRYPGYHFIAYTTSTSVYTIWRTNDQKVYSGTTRFETVINPGEEGGAEQTKKLLGVTVLTKPLASGESVKLKYRTDGDIGTASVWDGASENLILTHDTDGEIRKSAVNLASGANLPQYKEIQFRIESTGGAVVTGLNYRYEEINDDIYG